MAQTVEKGEVFALKKAVAQAPAPAYRSLQGGDVIYQVFMDSVARECRPGERPIGAFKRRIDAMPAGIGSIWMMPIRFWRGWNEI